MDKTRFKVVLNWQGEVVVFYRHTTSPNQALNQGIRELARRVGYSKKYVETYIMNEEARRWEVSSFWTKTI